MPLWMEREDDPDIEAHAFQRPVEDGRWQATCGLVADPVHLVQPEDEYGPRHLGCMIALGAEAAKKVGDSAWRP